MPHPPDPQQLKEIHTHHGRAPEIDGESNTGEQLDTSDDNRPKSRVRRHSQTPYSGCTDNPKKLGFYPSQWWDILEKAVKRWQMWMACECGFPNKGNENHLGKAMKCITDALAEH
jgi:hypothetical protein